jgi:hypothetical protein
MNINLKYDNKNNYNHSVEISINNNTETAYLLGLMPSESPDTQQTLFEKIIDMLVRTFQPSPVLTHVELFIPNTQSPTEDMLFSTYYGNHAGWASKFKDPNNFYLQQNGHRWRAIPVMGPGAISNLKNQCTQEENCQTQYSLIGYAFSVPPLRWVSFLRNNSVGAPAHCAALCARVLKSAIPSMKLPHNGAWYSPSTLYIELSKRHRMKAYHKTLYSKPCKPPSQDEYIQIKEAVDILRGGSDTELRSISTYYFQKAIQFQTRELVKKQVECTDDESQEICAIETALARMLLRWSLSQKSQ